MRRIRTALLSAVLFAPLATPAAAYAADPKNPMDGVAPVAPGGGLDAKIKIALGVATFLGLAWIAVRGIKGGSTIKVGQRRGNSSWTQDGNDELAGSLVGLLVVAGLGLLFNAALWLLA